MIPAREIRYEFSKGLPILDFQKLKSPATILRRVALDFRKDSENTIFQAKEAISVPARQSHLRISLRCQVSGLDLSRFLGYSICTLPKSKKSGTCRGFTRDCVRNNPMSQTTVQATHLFLIVTK